LKEGFFLLLLLLIIIIIYLFSVREGVGQSDPIFPYCFVLQKKLLVEVSPNFCLAKEVVSGGFAKLDEAGKIDLLKGSLFMSPPTFYMLMI